MKRGASAGVSMKMRKPSFTSSGTGDPAICGSLAGLLGTSHAVIIVVVAAMRGPDILAFIGLSVFLPSREQAGTASQSASRTAWAGTGRKPMERFYRLRILLRPGADCVQDVRTTAARVVPRAL